MEGRLQLATGLMWLAAPATAWDYWRVWNRLPARMAVHFDVHWHANGWTSREASLQFGLLLIGFMLAVFTIASYAATRSPAPKIVAWSLLTFFYGVLIFVCAVNHWVVRYNLRERAMSTCSVRQEAAGDFPKWRYPELHS